jgi:hypothetical protein
VRERRKRQINPLLEGGVRQLLALDRKLGLSSDPGERKEHGRRARQMIFGKKKEIYYPNEVGVWNFWGECYEAACDLGEFLDFEDRGAEVALPDLLAILRREKHEVGALAIIADMLDPKKPGPWKLELRRNVRGTPSEWRGSYNHWIALEYFELLEELQAQGVRSPAKEATRRLIGRYKFSDNDIRRAVQWWRKRGLKLKR